MPRSITRCSPGAAALLAAGLVCLLAAPAHAAGGAGAILKDCEADGRVDGSYGQAAYAKALSQLPTDLDEYSDCRAQIRSAQLRAAGTAATRAAPGRSRPAATVPVRSGGGPSGGSSSARRAHRAGAATARAAPSAPAPQPAPAAAPAAVAPVGPTPAAPVSAGVHAAAISPAQVAGGLTLLALAVGLTGVLAPRYLPRLLRRLR